MAKVRAPWERRPSASIPTAQSVKTAPNTKAATSTGSTGAMSHCATSNSDENQETCRRLCAWYENDRILNYDPSIVTIRD